MWGLIIAIVITVKNEGQIVKMYGKDKLETKNQQNLNNCIIIFMQLSLL
jgi:hypothetical protein